MCKRVLSFLLAASAVFCFICSSFPIAHAIVPLGLVQSALASYVTSAGYKLYNDQGTGQDILGSLGELYDEYVTLNSKTISGNLATLAYLANSPLIYTDNSGQICINAVAANIMQGFADWIQSNYSVPVGSQTPTEVIAPTSSGLLVDGSPVYVYEWSSSSMDGFNPSTTLDTSTWSYGSVPGRPNLIAYHASLSNGEYLYNFNSNSRLQFGITGSASGSLLNNVSTTVTAFVCRTDLSGHPTYWHLYNSRSNSWVASIELPQAYWDIIGSGSLVNGLGVSLAQAVADVVGQATDDDAVVIGVGAGIGATAQDIADAVASGVKAQTLEPSVSITAEAVIDTPVQPFPDIDGLGLPELGAALVSRFPFCIPWDFVDTVKLLNADPVAPDIAIDLFPAAFKSKVGVTGSTEFRFNLGDEKYQKIGLFCRWGSLIGFCFALAILTKRMIWTA